MQMRKSETAPSRHLPWAVATVGAFLLGLLIGQWRPAAFEHGPTAAVGEAAPHPQQAPARVRAADVSALAEVSSPADQGVGREPVAHLLERLARLEALDDPDAAAALRQEFFGRILDLARRGRGRDARAAIDAYLEARPLDVEARLLETDLTQMEGRSPAALESLLALLQITADVETAERVREKLALLVGVHESRLASRGDVPGLIRFFEDLAERDAVFDGHRLQLARWLLQGGRPAEAERVLAETGLTGVDPQARADLLAEVRLARSGLPLEHGPAAMHVRVSVGGRPLRLLVDTGATITVLGREQAISARSAPTGERVPVRTAAGVIEAELHRVHDLQVGALRLDDLPVLVLDRPLPEGVDGLLGMDVIARFGAGGRGGLLPDGR
jgi:clan AA aspartic protease (TIGR02281 family)